MESWPGIYSTGLVPMSALTTRITCVCSLTEYWRRTRVFYWNEFSEQIFEIVPGPKLVFNNAPVSFRLFPRTKTRAQTPRN